MAAEQRMVVGPPAATSAVPGDEAGFAALVRAHQRRVLGMARRFLRDAAAAEDLAQEVFLALYRHRDQIASERHLVFWLRQVTLRKCLDQKRRGPAPEALTSEPAAPTARGGDPWMRERLRRAVAELPPRARAVVVLRYQEDLDLEEIARVLEEPMGTVKSRLHRSLKHLRRRWPARKMATAPALAGGRQ